MYGLVILLLRAHPKTVWKILFCIVRSGRVGICWDYYQLSLAWQKNQIGQNLKVKKEPPLWLYKKTFLASSQLKNNLKRPKIAQITSKWGIINEVVPSVKVVFRIFRNRYINDFSFLILPWIINLLLSSPKTVFTPPPKKMVMFRRVLYHQLLNTIKSHCIYQVSWQNLCSVDYPTYFALRRFILKSWIITKYEKSRNLTTWLVLKQGKGYFPE